MRKNPPEIGMRHAEKRVKRLGGAKKYKNIYPVLESFFSLFAKIKSVSARLGARACVSCFRRGSGISWRGIHTGYASGYKEFTTTARRARARTSRGNGRDRAMGGGDVNAGHSGRHRAVAQQSLAWV